MAELQSPDSMPEVMHGDDEISLLDLLHLVAQNLRLLLLVPLAAGLLALGVSWTMQPTYTASTTFLPPQQPPSTAALMLQSLGPLAGAIGAGVTSTTDRYIAFIQSRTLKEGLIDRLDLVNRYAAKSREAAVETLGSNTAVVARKNGLIAIEIDDHDPKLAADIANGYVDELTIFLGKLNSTEAQSRREFFEQQLRKAKDSLVVAETALRTTGINESAVKANPAAAVGGVATLMAQVAAKEIEIGAMRGYLTANAPAFKQAQNELNALRGQLSQFERDNHKATSGSDYVAKYRNFKYYEALFELVARQYEAARIDESREGTLIQVVDRAVPPSHKSKPKKAQLAILTAIATGFALLLIVFLRHALRNLGRDPESARKLSLVRETARRAFRRS